MGSDQRTDSEVGDLGHDHGVDDDLLASVIGGDRLVPRVSRSWLSIVLWALGSIPAVATMLLLSMALRVRLSDGAWPVRNEPDPKELGIHHTITELCIVGSFLVAILVPIIALVGYGTGRRRLAVTPLLVAAVGFGVLMLILRADPGGLGRWIAD